MRIYVLLLAAFVLAHLLARLRTSLPERTTVARRRGAAPAPARASSASPSSSRSSARSRSGRRRRSTSTSACGPTLRRIASELLRARRGIDLDANPEAARRALGDETWELVRADREPPHDRFGRGIELDALRHVVVSLEAL